MRETGACVLLMAKPKAVGPCPEGTSSPVIYISRVARKACVSTQSVVHMPRSDGTERSKQ
ncbi:Uncharacterised protein [Oligella ureolytica]|uniref:Uncharacterized protein n=1 Tax=Oligella ureolytica TaxID=90244 RepID=A0A379B082_9BURK|nr:Uncharacterised protein [Oligella ureolytica]